MTGIPDKIGVYQIDGEIGRGGMGVVYRATDSSLGRTVAIKALPAHMGDNPELMARFEREAKTLAALNHANIGGIHGIESDQDRKYLILEYIDGETLADRIARGPLRVSEALDIGSRIADALAAAHDAGFVHRDLKPANVKITANGRVKVLDFGLARPEPSNRHRASSDATSTETVSHIVTTPGTILGTVQYMSPEQARGEDVDRQTDLWAFGVLLYESLTGTRPFDRGSAGECMAAIFADEPDLSALPATTPSEAVALIRRCLRKNARQRQRDACDCRLVLEDARETLSSSSAGTPLVRLVTEGRFRVSDELCRSLDRTGFDALLPGWGMQYADNNRDSDNLVVWIPSIGGDHTTTQWRELIETAPYRMVIVTPVGMEPGVDNRPVVSIENQFVLIRALTENLQATLNPKKTLISGFSCGSIMALRCAAGDDSGALFDGVLAIDPDLQEKDCFITRLFASLDASSTHDVMKGLREISAHCGTVNDWLVLHQHMIECVDKVKNDFSPLIRQGKDLSVDYVGVHSGADSPFVSILRNAIHRAGTVRCVFHDSAENRRMLGEIRMLHLDQQVLGEQFTDDVFDFLPVPDHIGMMSNERLLEQLDRIVDAVRI
jgi:serine/threonine protein kinase